MYGGEVKKDYFVSLQSKLIRYNSKYRVTIGSYLTYINKIISCHTSVFNYNIDIYTKLNKKDKNNVSFNYLYEGFLDLKFPIKCSF